MEVSRDNNEEPTQLLAKLTRYCKGEGGNLLNYQVSHVFGRAKSPYAFTAPWNVVYVPKIIDPFTGHEGKGARCDKFRQEFQRYVYGKFGNLIEDFNKIVTDRDLCKRMESYMNEAPLDTRQRRRLRSAVQENFAPIVGFADSHVSTAIR